MKINDNDFRKWKRFICFAQLSCLKSRFTDAWLMPKFWYCFVLWKYWTDNWNHFEFCCHHRNDLSSGGFRSADFVCHREIGRLWEAEEGVWGDLCRTERDGGTHSGTTEDIPKHVSKRGKSIHKSHSSCACFFLPFIFIVSGGGIALKSMQVNGANVITINFFVVSCLKGD